MTFELLLEDAKLMSNMISIISGIVAESRLHIEKDGIRIKAFDATRISLVDFFLKEDTFEKFTVKEGTAIGLSLETLNIILKTAKTNEKLLLSFDDKAKRFKVDFIAEKSKRSFALSLLEMPNEDNIPDTIHIDFDANFGISVSFLQQVLKDAEMISDYLRIHANTSKGVEFSAASDTKEMKALIEPKSEEIETDKYDVTNESSSVYSLDFSNFMKGVRSSEFVQVSFSQEQPIRIINEIEGKGRLIYFVAPRIEETEDINEEYEDYDDY